MTRNARALLIAGDDIGAAGTPAPGAADALDIVRGDLQERFAMHDITQLFGPTNQQVVDAFAAMRVRVAPGELFVVMFAGHGAKPDPSTPAQSWHLTECESLDDLELADQLLALREGVDSVVISDCCYGEGFFTTGAGIKFGRLVRALRETARGVPLEFMLAELEREQLEVQSSALGDVLRRKLKKAHRDSPMICVSAASKDDEVAQAMLPELARRTVLAARREQSYSLLETAFEANAPVDAAFHVDARPTTRFADRVLGA